MQCSFVVRYVVMCMVRTYIRTYLLCGTYLQRTNDRVEFSCDTH